MAKSITYDQYLNMLAEKSIDNTRQLKRSMTQRRNGMEDLYGICFTSIATLDETDNRYKAKFYISLSPDCIYLHRYAFKHVIMPSIIEDEDPSEGSDWRMTIAGVDVTAYLCEQQGTTNLFDGEGIYPGDDLADDKENFFDILDVASVMIAEANGDKTSVPYINAEKLLEPKFKKVEISSRKPFSADSYLYMKYSSVSR